MDNKQQKPNTMIEILKQMGAFTTKEEIAKTLASVIKAVSTTKDMHKSDIDLIKHAIVEIAVAHNAINEHLHGRIDKANIDLTKQTSDSIQKEVKNLTNIISNLSDKHEQDMKNIQDNPPDYEPIKAESVTRARAVIEPKIPSYENIRNAFEVFQGDDRLKVDAIGGLDEYIKKNIPNMRVSTAANRYLYELLDMNLSGIINGQSIKWNGQQWLPYTPSGGGGSTPVDNDILSGSGITFTLTNTPVAGSVHVFANGQRQTLGTDYTISGKIITFLTGSYGVGTIVADYQM